MRRAQAAVRRQFGQAGLFTMMRAQIGNRRGDALIVFTGLLQSHPGTLAMPPAGSHPILALPVPQTRRSQVQYKPVTAIASELGITTQRR